MNSLHFDITQHKALDCETLVINMQNLKHKENDLMVQEVLGALNLNLLEQNSSWKLPKEEMHFLFMLFSHKMLNHIHMKFLLNTKNLKMCLRREMWTPCTNIDHMIAPLILWKEHNFHLDPFIICRKSNL
jgi:hypothetical protein